MMHRIRPNGCWRRGNAVALLGALLLAGCDGRFSADLAADAPADPAITQVQASVLGLAFQKATGESENFEFRGSAPVDLLGLLAGTPMQLFTSERLSAGQYTGVRLLIDGNADLTVVNSIGGEFPARLVDGPFAVVDFTVEDQQRSSESLTLTLNLRQSLTFNDVDGEYTLTPTIRTVRTDEAAQLTGFVNVTCPASVPLTTAAAVYVFAGADVLPDDVDGIGIEPYATSRVDLSTGVITYLVRFLPPGDYTLAVTCTGDLDQPDTDDAIDFVATQNARLAAGQTLQLDLT